MAQVHVALRTIRGPTHDSLSTIEAAVLPGDCRHDALLATKTACGKDRCPKPIVVVNPKGVAANPRRTSFDSHALVSVADAAGEAATLLTTRSLQFAKLPGPSCHPAARFWQSTCSLDQREIAAPVASRNKALEIRTQLVPRCEQNYVRVNLLSLRCPCKAHQYNRTAQPKQPHLLKVSTCRSCPRSSNCARKITMLLSGTRQHLNPSGEERC